MSSNGHSNTQRTQTGKSARYPRTARSYMRFKHWYLGLALPWRIIVGIVVVIVGYALLMTAIEIAVIVLLILFLSAFVRGGEGSRHMSGAERISGISDEDWEQINDPRGEL